MGPLISGEQRARVEGYVERGKADGARLVVGGGRRDDLGAGYFFEPAARRRRPTLCHRPGGDLPAGALDRRYDDEDDAVAIANDAMRPRGIRLGRRHRARIGGRTPPACGMVSVNGGSFIGADLPFGGRRQSGFGREWGVAGFEEFLDLKSVGVGAPPS